MNGSSSRTASRCSSPTTCSRSASSRISRAGFAAATDEVSFVQNLYLSQTNVCRVKCKFCAFAATQRQEHAYSTTTEELVRDAVEQHRLAGFTEIHMVNGENPHIDLDFYLDTLRALKAELPDVHLKCYTASEVHHMTTLSGLTHEEVLAELKAAGLGSLPGGGAEIFADRVRALVAPGKEHADIWFHVHDTAHRMGLRSTCTMLYGHVETYEERIDHLLRLREQQDRTGGFVAFIPLAFHPENTVFERRGFRHTTGVRRPQDDGGLAPDARQHPEHQGVLDHDGYAALCGRAPLRRQRRAGHRDAGDDLPRRRSPHRDRAEGRPARPLRARGGPDPGAARLPSQPDPAMVTLTRAIPALPVRDAASAVVFYRDRLGFEILHHDGGFAVVCRDEAVLHLWESSDESWRERDDLRDRPVCSGAESFIAGTASCRIMVDEVDAPLRRARAERRASSRVA